MRRLIAILLIVISPIVVQPDDRWQVSPTTSLPYQAVAQLSVSNQFGQPLGQCSGVFIGPKVVLTAAHCLYNRAFPGWAWNVTVTPGLDGSMAPFGSAVGAQFAVPTSWIESLGSAYGSDWGLIILPDDQLGQKVGSLTIAVLPTSTLQLPDFGVMTAGYPGDKPHDTQWASLKPAFAAVDLRRLLISNNIYGGQSGSAVWRQADSLVVGVVSSELLYSDGSGWNVATRIDAENLATMIAACQQLDCSLNYQVDPALTLPPPALVSKRQRYAIFMPVFHY